MARRLATSPEARERRERSLRRVLAVGSVSGAVNAAADIVALATEDAKAYTEARDTAERDEFLVRLGINPGDAVPPALRAQVRALEENHKRRATRSLRDGVDRVLTDLESLFRDIVVIELEGNVPLTNEELRSDMVEWLSRHDSEHAIRIIDAIATARHRIDRNVTPLLSLEALFIVASGIVEN
jgi:DNA polymerase-3 subunit delta'